MVYYFARLRGLWHTCIQFPKVKYPVSNVFNCSTYWHSFSAGDQVNVNRFVEYIKSQQDAVNILKKQVPVKLMLCRKHTPITINHCPFHRPPTPQCWTYKPSSSSDLISALLVNSWGHFECFFLLTHLGLLQITFIINHLTAQTTSVDSDVQTIME